MATSTLRLRFDPRPNQIGVVHWTWTISPTIVNDAYVSGAADHVNIGIDTSTGLYDRTKYGINYPYLYDGAQKVLPNKIPTIQIANFTTLDGGPYPRAPAVSSMTSATVSPRSGATTPSSSAASGSIPARTTSTRSTSPARFPDRPIIENGFFVFSDARGGNKAAPVPTTNVAAANAAVGLFDTYAEIGTRSYTPSSAATCLKASRRISGV